MQTTEQLHKKFTQTARWLSVEEVGRLLKFYETYEHKDSQLCIDYLNRMLKENFCIGKERVEAQTRIKEKIKQRKMNKVK